MTTPQFYFLLLAIATFLIFAVALAASCVSYHRWRRSQSPPLREWHAAQGLPAPGD